MGSEHIYDVLKICILFKISQRFQIKFNQKNFNFNTHMMKAIIIIKTEQMDNAIHKFIFFTTSQFSIL